MNYEEVCRTGWCLADIACKIIFCSVLVDTVLGFHAFPLNA